MAQLTPLSQMLLMELSCLRWLPPPSHGFMPFYSWIWIIAVDLPPKRRMPTGSTIRSTRQIVATAGAVRLVLPRRVATSPRRHSALIACLGRRCLPSTTAVLAVVQPEKMGFWAALPLPQLLPVGAACIRPFDASIRVCPAAIGSGHGCCGSHGCPSSDLDLPSCSPLQARRRGLLAASLVVASIRRLGETLAGSHGCRPGGDDGALV
ncbi:hypothetical protein ACLOJK_004131 [Asimina triloba]